MEPVKCSFVTLPTANVSHSDLVLNPSQPFCDHGEAPWDMSQITQETHFAAVGHIKAQHMSSRPSEPTPVACSRAQPHTVVRSHSTADHRRHSPGAHKVSGGSSHAAPIQPVPDHIRLRRDEAGQAEAPGVHDNRAARCHGLARDSVTRCRTLLSSGPKLLPGSRCFLVSLFGMLHTASSNVGQNVRHTKSAPALRQDFLVGVSQPGTSP